MLDRQSITEGITIRVIDPAGMLVLTGGGPEWAPRTQFLAAGDVLTVDERTLDANLDRHGESWLFLADDPERQVSLWGRVRFTFASDDYTPEPVQQQDSRYRVHSETIRIYGTQAQQRSPYGFTMTQGSR